MPVTCSRCGAENPAAARFCMSCGNPLPASEPTAPAENRAGEAPPFPAAPTDAPTAAPRGAAPTGAPAAAADGAAAPRPPTSAPSSLPPQFRSLRAAPSHLPATDPEWRMSPAGPLPDPPKRRIWVWVLVALGAVLLLCVVLTLIGSLAGNPNLQPPAGQ